VGCGALGTPLSDPRLRAANIRADLNRIESLNPRLAELVPGRRWGGVVKAERARGVCRAAVPDCTRLGLISHGGYGVSMGPFCRMPCRALRSMSFQKTE
jgi:hypothetical protein